MVLLFPRGISFPHHPGPRGRGRGGQSASETVKSCCGPRDHRGLRGLRDAPHLLLPCILSPCDLVMLSDPLDQGTQWRQLPPWPSACRGSRLRTGKGVPRT